MSGLHRSEDEFIHLRHELELTRNELSAAKEWANAKAQECGEIRAALVRALDDVKRGNDNIEKLVAEIRQRSRERSMLMAQNERAAALVWAIRKAATGTSATHDPLWADVWNVCNAIECARDAEGAIPDEQPDREDDAHEPNEASRGY
jgi:hypothetical protein